MDETRWIDDAKLEIGGTTFVAAAVPLGHTSDFVVIKSPHLVRRYLALLDAEAPRRIVELGVKDGGSTALITLAGRPDLLLAVDLEAEIPDPLARLIETRDLQGSLVTAFGLDQGDRGGLTRFVESHLPDGGVDLVIDDASHILGPTRTSFEVLFPRLRPGGLYVIEDWNSELITATRLAHVLPQGPDFADRLGSVNQVLHVLNNPEHDLPPDFLAGMVAAAAATADDESDTRDPDLFLRIVEVASRVDASMLDGAAIGRSRPLSDLAVELMMIGATRPDLIDEVQIDGEWISVRRGTAQLDPDQFRLGDAWTDFFGYLS